MQINVTFDQSVSSLPTGFVSAVNYVVNYFDSLFTNNCTINIYVGWGEVGGSTFGSMPSARAYQLLFSASYSSLRSALLAQNAPGSSTLPSTSPFAAPFYCPGRSKALGLTSSTGLDGMSALVTGFVGLHNRDTAADQYYLIGTIEHEITEIMGRYR